MLHRRLMTVARLVSRPRWLTPLLFGAVLAILVVLIARQWDVLVAFPWRLNLLYLGLALTCHSIALGATFVVWHLMVAKLAGFHDLGMNFRFYYLSTLAKRVPTAIWYVGGRIAMYQQVGVPVASIANVIVLEPIILALGGVLTLLCFVPFYSTLPSERITPFAGLGVAGVALLLFRPRLFADVTNWILGRFHAGRLDRVPSRQDLVSWLAINIVPWLFAGCSLYCAVCSVTTAVSVPLVDAIGISTVAMLVSLLSLVLPGGLGLKELTTGALLLPWMPFSTAMVIVIAYRLMQTLNEMVWALIATRVRTDGMMGCSDPVRRESG